MAEATFKTLEKTDSKVKLVKSLSPSASNFCFSCSKDFRTISGNPKDVKRKLFHHLKVGDEGLALTPAGEIVKKYMDVQLQTLDLPEICRDCIRSIKNGQEALVKCKKLLSESCVTNEKFVRNKIKRMFYSPAKQSKKITPGYQSSKIARRNEEEKFNFCAGIQSSQSSCCWKTILGDGQSITLWSLIDVGFGIVWGSEKIEKINSRRVGIIGGF